MGYFESFIGINFWTAFFVLFNTILIYVVAKKFLIVPIHNMIVERQNEIDGMYADAGKARSDAQAMQAEYQEKLAHAQATGERLVREAVERGQNREEEIVRQANEEAAAIREKAARDAEQEKRKALNDAKDEISGIAMAIAERVVGRELTGADQSALVDHFIDELGDKA